MDRLKRNMDIIIILVVGFALRFTISFTHSYSNDELSAINRLQYNNFSELVEKGVKTGDMHPAGVQVFMKLWSHVAGVNELGMRFPFVICGTLSILLIFLIGKRWINRQAGIIAAIFLSLLYFPILNSEFARPYSPGLMFCLLAAWFYLQILFSEERKYKDAIFFGLSVAAAMYTHHFAFLFVGWLGISGIFLWKKENWKHVLIGGGLAVLLYVPHISITKYQISVGGLGWLGPPNDGWLFDFIFHVFNESWWVLGGVLLLIAMSFILDAKTELINKRALILCTAWFLGIYLIGHLYSLTFTPVLKYPVMLFALPFLIIPIAYLLSRSRHQVLQYSVLMILLASSTTREKDLFGNMHFELFKEIAEDMVRWDEDFGADNVYTVYNINNPNYMNFYANQWGKEITFDWDVIEFWSADSLRADLKERPEQYCVVGYSGRLTKPDIFETCKEFFPNLLEYKKYNNSAVFLLAKNRPSQLTQNKARLTLLNASNQIEGWKIGEQQYREDSMFVILPTDSIAYEGYVRTEAYVSDEQNPYGPDFEFTLSQIEDPYTKYIKVNVLGYGRPGGQLTVYVNATRNGEQLMVRDEPFWLGRDIEQYLINEKRAYFVFKVPDILKENDVVKIGIWNRNPEIPMGIQLIDIQVYDNIWN